MKKKTLTHISSIILLGFFIFLAFGSVDDEDTNKSLIETKTDDSLDGFNSPIEKETEQPINKIEEKARVEQFINTILKIDKQTSKTAKYALDLAINSTKPTVYDYLDLLKSAKKNCENTMFSISDLDIPSGITTKTKSSLKNIRENLSQKHSYTSMALGMLISFIKTDDMSYFYGYLDDYEKAVDYNDLAIREMLTNRDIMDIMTEKQKKVIKQEEESKSIEKKLENEGNEIYPIESSETDIDNNETNGINTFEDSYGEKKKKNRRKEERRTKRNEKKKNKKIK